MADLAGLPDPGTAPDDPEQAAATVNALVRASLAEDWREENARVEVLDRLAELINVHLDHFVGGASPSDTLLGGHEGACAACLKLARNLCAGRPWVQEHWRDRGLVETLAPRLRAEMAWAGEERSLAWREAVPSFLATVVAGHEELRRHALGALFPHGLAGAFALCREKPFRAFMLAQNLFASQGGEEGVLPSSAKQLVDTSDGHCLLLLLASLLCDEGADEPTPEVAAVQAQSREWASIFFFSLWSRGGFPAAYRGLKRLGAQTVQEFLRRTMEPAGLSEDLAVLAQSKTVVTVPVADALGLLWHSVHGLIAGTDAAQSTQASDMTRKLVRALLGDADFAEVLAAELSEACAQLADAWGLDWTVDAVSEDAAAALGVDAALLNALPTAPCAAAAAAAAPEGGDAEAALDVWGRGTVAADAGDGAVSGGSGSGPFAELVQAALELTSAARAPGDLPPLLAGALLTRSVALIRALHKFRFGDLSAGAAPKREAAPVAVRAAHACQLVDQLRLCGNVLFENPKAQEFLRATDGIYPLLNHCYADHDLPLLREAGVLAVRNATHRNAANQCAVRELLAQRRLAAGPPGQGDAAAGSAEGDAVLPPAIDEMSLGL